MRPTLFSATNTIIGIFKQYAVIEVELRRFDPNKTTFYELSLEETENGYQLRNQFCGGMASNYCYIDNELARPITFDTIRRGLSNIQMIVPYFAFDDIYDDSYGYYCDKLKPSVHYNFLCIDTEEKETLRVFRHKALDNTLIFKGGSRLLTRQDKPLEYEIKGIYEYKSK